MADDYQRRRKQGYKMMLRRLRSFFIRWGWLALMVVSMLIILYLAYNNQHIFRESIIENFNKQQFVLITALEAVVKDHIEEAEQNLRTITREVSRSGNPKESANILSSVYFSHEDDFLSMSIYDNSGRLIEQFPKDSGQSRNMSSIQTAIINYTGEQNQPFISPRYLYGHQSTVGIIIPFELSDGERYFTVGLLKIEDFLEQHFSAWQQKDVCFILANHEGDVLSMLNVKHDKVEIMSEGNIRSLDEICLNCHKSNDFADIIQVLETGQINSSIFYYPNGKVKNRNTTILPIYNETWSWSVCTPYKLIQGAIDKNTSNILIFSTVSLLVLGFITYVAFKARKKRVIIEAEAENLKKIDETSTALARTEDKFRTLFEESLDAIFFTSSTGDFIEMNRTGRKLFGYSNEEIKKINIKELFMNQEDYNAFLHTVENQGLVKDYERDLRHKDGTPIKGLLNVLVRKDDFGNIERYEGIIHDITKRKEAEEALAEAAELDRKRVNEIKESLKSLQESQYATLNIMEDLTNEIEQRKKIAEDLKVSQEYTQSLIDSSLDMIIAVDMNRNITEFNKAAEKTFGYGSEEVLGKHISLLYADEIQGHEVHRMTIEKRQHVQEVLNKRKSGEVFPALLAASTLVDTYGNVIGVMGVSRDITESKKAEEALRESEERYRGLVNTSPLGIAIHQEGKFVLVNDYMLKMTGYEEEEIIGKSVLDIIVPSERKHIAKRISEMIRSGEPAPAIEERILSKDGRTLYAMVAGAPITYQGKPAVEVSAIDISNIKKMEKAREESEKKFRSVIEQSNDGIYVLQDNRFVFTNNRFAEITGYQQEDLSGPDFNFKKIVAPEGLKIIEERETMRKQGLEPDSRYTFKGLRKDGHKRDFEVSVTRVDWVGKKATLGILQDVTESIEARRRLEEALEKAKEGERVKTLFLANMSHEIRTPLNSILGFTDLIEMSAKDKVSPEEQEFFNTIRQSGKRLMHTIHEILDMSQIEAKTMPVHIEECNLADIVIEVVTPFISIAQSKGLELNIDTNNYKGFISADENLVAKAISNVVENAIKYTDSGKIDVELMEKDNIVALSIKDTGIGIEKEYIDEMFQTFTQESEGYTKKYQGVGLGLALTKRYLDLCHAEIEVKSEKGVGSSFTMFFKKVKRQPRKKQVEKLKKQAVVETEAIEERPLVLVVEDDMGSQRLVHYFLRDRYELDYAVSVTEAKDKLKEKVVQMVLLDLSLIGDEDGLDLARYMRKRKRWQGIPIIATTAHAFTEDRDKCLKAGCNDYISKPLNKDELLEKMKDQIKV